MRPTPQASSPLLGPWRDTHWAMLPGRQPAVTVNSAPSGPQPAPVASPSSEGKQRDRAAGWPISATAAMLCSVPYPWWCPACLQPCVGRGGPSWCCPFPVLWPHGELPAEDQLAHLRMSLPVPATVAPSGSSPTRWAPPALSWEMKMPFPGCAALTDPEGTRPASLAAAPHPCRDTDVKSRVCLVLGLGGRLCGAPCGVRMSALHTKE